MLSAALLVMTGCPKSDGPKGEPHDGGSDGDADVDADGDVDIRDAEPDARYRPDGGIGFPLGSWQIEYGQLAYEPNFPGAPSAPIRTCEGEVIKVVAPAFAEQLTIDHRGYLEDGRVIQEAGALAAGGSCYAVMDPASSPWGVGSYSRPLEPFRSVAVDPALAGDGRWLYVPQLDGKRMPGEERGLSFLHDGCVRVDDAGATGEVLSLYVAFPGYATDLQSLLSTSTVDVYQDSLYCER
jgi:hypothetical protein